MKEEKYLSRIVGSAVGFYMSMFSMMLMDKPNPEVWHKSKDLENKIWYLEKASDYIKVAENDYLLTPIDMKRDSLIAEKKSLDRTFEYKEWREGDNKRKRDDGIVLGLGLLAGFAGGSYVDKKRIRRNPQLGK